MKTAVVCGLILAAVVSSRADDPFADAVISYVPGTGLNTSYENSSAALGAPSTGATITAPAYTNTSIVGIGNGGELTVEFDTPILNDPGDHADGMDFTIFGNEFFVLGSKGITGIYNHPGLTVWVSQDNITYYQLASATGADDLYPTAGSGNPELPVNPAFTLSSFVGMTATQALALYDDSAGGASYSISSAEDASGEPVDLPSISYIKVEGSGGYGYVDAFARVEDIPEPRGPVLTILGMAVAAGLRSFLSKSKRMGSQTHGVKRMVNNAWGHISMEQRMGRKTHGVKNAWGQNAWGFKTHGVSKRMVKTHGSKRMGSKRMGSHLNTQQKD